MKYLLFSVIIFVFTASILAQNEVDAIRYSQENLGSTARSFAVGGAFGAVGADPSCANINPAGLAKFRSSKLYLSTAFYNAKNKTTYLGNELTDNKFNFNLPNLGLIVNIPGEDYNEKKPKGFVNFVFGLNVNRLNNFHKRTFADGINTSNSITQNWAERANNAGVKPSKMFTNSLELLAWNTAAIDPENDSTPVYKSAYDTSGRKGFNSNQSATNRSRGAINDYNISFAANYRHIIQGGISIGFKKVRYIEDNSFIETDLKKGNAKDIKSLTLDQYLRTTGSGFNAKLGFIVSPSEFFRFGYSFHSPTIYNLTDSYQYTLDAKFDYGAKDFNGSPRNDTIATTGSAVYKYKITTPARQVMSFVMINKEIGFISVDLEYVSYAGASLSAKDYSFIPENKRIAKNYNSVLNLRMGAEIIQDKFRYRVGYARYPSPYKSAVVPNLMILVNNVYTLGFGIKTEDYSIDIAYVNSGYTDYYVPYDLKNGKYPVATNNVRTTNLVITAGFNID